MSSETKSQTSSAIEREQFWFNHIKQCNCSGVSKAEYCRINGVDYDRFFYWCKKYSQVSDISDKLPASSKEVERSGFIPVQLKIPTKVQHPESSAADPIVGDSGILCSLAFKDGALLKIYNPVALSVLVEILG